MYGTIILKSAICTTNRFFFLFLMRVDLNDICNLGTDVTLETQGKDMNNVMSKI